MEITNKFNLPEALVRAAKNDSYSFTGDISTTSLISPPRLYQLRKRHDAALSEDVSKRVWSMFGQGVHAVLEKSKSPGSIVEERFYAEVEGWIVGGQIDVYEPSTQTLYDYKITKVWNYQNGPSEEWVAQGNVNRWLLEHKTHELLVAGHIKRPIEVKRLTNVLFLKDWAGYKATGVPQKNGKIYPPQEVMTVDMPLWDLDFTADFIRDRVKKHQEAKKLEDKDLPECTEEETWNGRRCESYCIASSVCSQYNTKPIKPLN